MLRKSNVVKELPKRWITKDRVRVFAIIFFWVNFLLSFYYLREFPYTLLRFVVIAVALLPYMFQDKLLALLTKKYQD